MGQAAKVTGHGEVLGAMPTVGVLRAKPYECFLESCSWGSGPPRRMWPPTRWVTNPEEYSRVCAGVLEGGRRWCLLVLSLPGCRVCPVMRRVFV